MFTIRTALASDAGQVAAVHVAAWQATYSGLLPAEYLVSLDVGARQRMWQDTLAGTQEAVDVAETGTGSIVGFASYGRYRGDMAGIDGELYSIYLLPHCQRQGLGKQLTLRAAAGLRARGCSAMAAWVLRGNPAAAFYERLGGQRIAERQITIAGVSLPEDLYAWTNLSDLAPAAELQ